MLHLFLKSISQLLVSIEKYCAKGSAESNLLGDGRKKENDRPNVAFSCVSPIQKYSATRDKRKSVARRKFRVICYLSPLLR